MNCEEIQRRLLALTEPVRPTPVVQGHLDECPACLEVQRRLVQIEQPLCGRCVKHAQRGHVRRRLALAISHRGTGAGVQREGDVDRGTDRWRLARESRPEMPGAAIPAMRPESSEA